MKHVILFISVLTLVAKGQIPAKRYLIRNANVIDVRSGRILTNTSILIDGERIASVGKKIKKQKEDSVVDATGKYVIPGLWDMHTHVFGQYERAFLLLLANGITGIRNMHTTVKNPMQLLARIRQGLKDKTIFGPRLVANGQSVNGEPAQWPSEYIVHNADEAKAAVDSLIRGGGDFIKVYDHLSREEYFAIAEECNRRNFPFEGHVPVSVTVEEAAMAGQKSIEHNTGLLYASTATEKELKQEDAKASNDSMGRIAFRHMVAAQDIVKRKEICQFLAARHVWQCPTLSVLEINSDTTVVNDPLIIKYMSVAGYKAAMDMVTSLKSWNATDWENSSKSMNLQFTIVKELSNQGAPLLAGTDVGNPGLLPGFSLHHELALLVKAGLTPLQALQAATYNPADFFNLLNDLGTVEKRKLADLVILDANPLTDMQNTKSIFAVISNGSYLDRQRLDSLLSAASAQAKKEK